MLQHHVLFLCISSVHVTLTPLGTDQLTQQPCMPEPCIHLSVKTDHACTVVSTSIFKRIPVLQWIFRAPACSLLSLPPFYTLLPLCSRSSYPLSPYFLSPWPCLAVFQVALPLESCSVFCLPQIHWIFIGNCCCSPKSPPILLDYDWILSIGRFTGKPDYVGTQTLFYLCPCSYREGNWKLILSG